MNTKNPITQNYYTAKQAAARIGVGIPQVTRYCANGSLPSIRFGKTLLIPKVSVTNFERPKRGNPNFGKNFWKKIAR